VRKHCVAGCVYRGITGRRFALRCGCLTTDVERAREVRSWLDAEVMQRRSALEGAIVVEGH
jgi:hypothetical protein